jgi:hypothetical protein
MAKIKLSVFALFVITTNSLIAQENVSMLEIAVCKANNDSVFFDILNITASKLEPGR